MNAPSAHTASNLEPAQLLASRVTGMRSSAVRDLLHDARRPGMLSLAGGLPAPDLFDVDGMGAACADLFAKDARHALQYGPTEGEPALRALIAQGLRERGADVDDAAPIITTGSQQGLDLVARALLDPGDGVIVERPSYLAALQVFALAQAQPIGVPGDADGLRIDALPEQGQPKLVYVVSNFANPTGATLTLERRLALLQWAVRRQVVVIEDDPYGVLRVEGEELPPMLALAKQVPGSAQWVGYLTSLSKSLAPGLRVGCAVLPPWLRDAVVRTKQAADLHTSTLSQELAARYLATGALARRLPMMRAAYRERRDALCELLTQTFGDRLAFERPQGGMFVWARFTDGTDTAALLPIARDEGMIFVPGEAFYDAEPDVSSIRLSFSTATREQLAEAVRRLERAHAKMHAQGTASIGKTPVCSPANQARPEAIPLSAQASSHAIATRDACVQAALDAWEDAGIRGLCAEGRWEAAIGAMESLDPARLEGSRAA